MKLLLLNVDPSRDDHTPWSIKALGASGVRLVLKPDNAAICRTYSDAGLKVLGVIALESVAGFPAWGDAAFYYAVNHTPDYTQVGNEPDQVGPSSWTMSQDEYNDLVYVFQRHGPVMGAGLASGQPDWLNGVETDYLTAIAVHPYSEGVTIPGWLDGYRPFGKPFWITEWWPNEAATRIALSLPDVEAVAWWWHDPVGDDALGIKGHPDRIAAFQRLAAELEAPGGDMPEFVLGFKDYAQAHPEVGQPVEDQWYETHGLIQVARQDTTTGTLRHYPQSNQIVWSPLPKA